MSDDFKQIVVRAARSRVLIIVLQYFANIAIPDHDADAFKSPRGDQPMSIADRLIDHLLGGFRRWDAEYYLHIAEHDYTSEQSFAFYPLYPLIVRFVSARLSACLPFECSVRELSLLVAVGLNIVFFALAAHALFVLTTALWPNKRLARIVVALFCTNPASIFFTAPYSESLFCWLTFKVMLNSANLRFVNAIFWVALSVLCRSNGVINVGFIFYHMFAHAMKGRRKLMRLVRYIPGAVSCAVITFVAMLGVQMYFHGVFCVDYKPGRDPFNKYHNMDIHWCHFTIPFSYSYIQSKYWNVGFLNYYEFKQIPNFLLATPILLFILSDTLRYLKRTISLRPLGINRAFWAENERRFVYVAHVFFLWAVCILYVHIQVSTRMLASSSPILYWVSAHYFYKEGCGTNWWSSPKSLMTKFIRLWFFGYIVVGTTLFANFYPWT